MYNSIRKEVLILGFKYYKLMDLLNRKSMSKEDLRLLIGISSSTMSKISANKIVSLEVLEKICKALDCQPADIMEYEKTE